jgi:hypothetical protein
MMPHMDETLDDLNTTLAQIFDPSSPLGILAYGFLGSLLLMLAVAATRLLYSRSALTVRNLRRQHRQRVRLAYRACLINRDYPGRGTTSSGVC